MVRVVTSQVAARTCSLNAVRRATAFSHGAESSHCLLPVRNGARDPLDRNSHAHTAIENAMRLRQSGLTTGRGGAQAAAPCADDGIRCVLISLVHADTVSDDAEMVTGSLLTVDG
jgi:hypothetical protein